MNIIAEKNKIRVERSDHSNTRKGLLFIPDISGFTELVHNTDLVTGQMITYELLSTIIRHNHLNMQVAEIEGDAIFFFKWDAIPSIEVICKQFELIKIAFDDKLRELQIKYDMKLDLHLKAIAHYGEMAAFSIGGFRKLYGEVVIEAHRLLKNGIPGKSYLLITDQFVAAKARQLSVNAFAPVRSSTLCELYSGLSKLCFTYILFEGDQLSA